MVNHQQAFENRLEYRVHILPRPDGYAVGEALVRGVDTTAGSGEEVDNARVFAQCLHGQGMQVLKPYYLRRLNSGFLTNGLVQY